MVLTTKVSLPEISIAINHTNSVLFIGSCFSTVFGNKLKDHKFSVLSNPFGTVYNPVSIAQMIHNIVDNFCPLEEEMNVYNDIHFHYNYHSDLSALTQKELLANIQTKTNLAHHFLHKTNVLFITLGTSFVYVRSDNNHIVANCHKVPTAFFNKRLLSSEEIYASLSSLIQSLQSRFPDINVVFTVSPVRHVRDGLIENNQSKARLIDAVHNAVDNSKKVFYFPSYEILMDELRDYRYFEKDLIHPNELAHEVIWDYFSQVFFNSPTKLLNAKIDKINKAKNHRPLFENHPDYISFCQKQIEEIKALQIENRGLDFSKEYSYFLSKVS
ncbi:MAG: GSCFA domain-containing protein [Saprospiraceae bacterium]